DRLAELFEAASASLAVRSVLLTGTGKAFCAGADLRGPRPTVAVLPGNEAPEGAPERAPGDVARMIRRGWQRLVGSILDCEKPATEWAERLAGGPTKTIAMTKWLLNRSLESDRGTAFYEEGWAQEAVSATEDSREGRASFVERRPPNFRGW